VEGNWHAETPLYWAASSDDVEVARARVDGGADVQAAGASIASGSLLDNEVSNSKRRVPSSEPARGRWSPARTIMAVERAQATNGKLQEEQRRAKSGQRVLRSFRWGLVPHWAKDLRSGARMINARAETVAQRPAYREAIMTRRVLLPFSGFYE
jgi:putative SOS response-associated peptidase YedK